MQYPMLQVRDILKDKGGVITLETDQTLYDARNIMLRHNISTTVILWDHRYIVGVVTEKDIIRFLYKGTRGRRLDEIKVHEAMSRDVVTGKKDESLVDCAKKILDKKIGSVIIVEPSIDNYWDIVGIVTKTDIIKAYELHYRGKHKVADFMSEKVYTVLPSDPLHEAMLFMVNSNISRVIVVEKEKPVGMITMHDILPVGTLVNPFFSRFDQSDFKMASPPTLPASIPSGVRAKFVASDLMKTDLVTITKDRDLAEAARLMVEKRISGLPVIEQNHKDARKNGKLVGLITKTDITRAMVSQQAKSPAAA